MGRFGRPINRDMMQFRSMRRNSVAALHQCHPHERVRRVEQLLSAVERLLRGLDVPPLAAFLPLWPPPPWPCRTQAPASLPVLRWLDAACAGGAPETAPVLAELRTMAPRLAWAQTYTTADRDAAFLDRYGWTELIGTRGPVPSADLAAGFLLLGPETEYPAHRHDAEELYLPLSGTALWQRGDEPWRSRAPGTPIHHPGRMPHAMRTGADPMLALYLWRGGDLAEKSRFD